MSEQIQGTQPATEISQVAPPAHVELSQQTQPAAVAAAPAASQPAAVAPDVTALQAQLAQEQALRHTAELRHRDTQAAFTRSQQALQHLSGAPAAAADPNAVYIKSLVDQGYDPKDATVMVGTMQQMLAPVLAQSHQAASIAQSSFLVDSTLQTAFSQAPQAFAVPGVQQIVHRQLQEDAARGLQFDANYATALAKQAWFDTLHGPQTQQSTQFVQQPAPQIRSMTGISGNHSAPQHSVQNQVTRTPEQEGLRGFLQNRLANPTA